MSENWGQTELSEREIGGAGPVPLGGEVSHNVAPGAETFEIIKSEGAQYLVLRGEAGTHRIRPGKLDRQTFLDAAVTVATDNIAITGHGYVTGDGPLFLSQSGGGALPTGLAINTPFWIIRVDDDNFKLASSPGNANRPSLETALEGGSDAIPVDITAAAAGGTHEIGGNQGASNQVGFDDPVAAPAADLADGGSIPLIANEVVIFHGRAITVRATAAADILTWWEI